MKKILSVLLLLSICFCIPVKCLAKTIQNEDLSITANRNRTHSRLSKDYDGYIYHLTNKTNGTITLQSITMEDSTSGLAAAKGVQKSSLGIGAKTIADGVLWALPTLTLSIWGSIILAPVKMVSNSFGNVGAKQEGKRYDRKPEFPYTLNNCETVEIRALGVRHHNIKFKVLYNTADDSTIKELGNY